MNNAVQKENKKENKAPLRGIPMLPQRFIALLAQEIAKTVATYLLPLLKKTPKKKRKNSLYTNTFFLDTSAIIDRRIFDVVTLGLLTNNLVVIEPVLFELKRIADSKDEVKRERGRKGLELLEKIKKGKMVKVFVLSENGENKREEVDEKLIKTAKSYKGKIITCDYNLEKKASIQGVLAINVNALANSLKVTALPGELLSVKVLHEGKDKSQGVSYLNDGTMIVVEEAGLDLGKTLDVVISKVIQTASGRILFAKKV